jgi:hypothetical protein
MSDTTPDWLVSQVYSYLEIATKGFKQDGTVILTYRRTILVYKKGFAPQMPKLNAEDEL